MMRRSGRSVRIPHGDLVFLSIRPDQSVCSCPLCSGAAYNGDMATVTFGFSAQVDEAPGI